jgi:hypothetical protein
VENAKLELELALIVARMVIMSITAGKNILKKQLLCIGH